MGFIYEDMVTDPDDDEGELDGIELCVEVNSKIRPVNQ